MGPNETFEQVINFVNQSNLNFIMYRTPYSANFTIKKSFKKVFDENENAKLDDENRDLLRELSDLKIHFATFKQATVKNENLIKAKNEALKKVLENNRCEIEGHDLNVKKLNKMIKEKDKKIHELEKVANKVKEDTEKEIKELKDFKVQVLYQKKEDEKQRKKATKENHIEQQII